MSASIVLISILLSAAINSQQVSCKDAEFRDANEVGIPSRANIYGQLLPFRSFNGQLLPLTGMEVEEGHSSGIDSFPQSYSLQLTQGHTLSRVPADERNFYNLRPIIGVRYIDEPRAQWLAAPRGVGGLQGQRPSLASGIRNQRLMSETLAPDGSPDLPSEESNGQQQTSGASSYGISTRSGQPRFPHNNKSYISNLLYGNRLSSSMPGSFGSNFNKKAEPKDNYFMHFGRK